MKNQKLHDDVKILARTYLESERNLIGKLIVVQEREAYKDFKVNGVPKYKGLFKYCLGELNFTPSVAQMFRTVVNHAIALPELKEALESDRIGAVYASKIASNMTPDNVAEILEYTQEHSIRETERWLAKEHGAEEFCNFKMTVANREFLRELKDIVPGNLADNEVLHRILKFYRDSKHPVERARKAALRKAKAGAKRANSGTAPERKSKVRVNRRSRKPLTAEERHAVHLRDEHRCTYRDGSGDRCKETRWLHQHHIELVSDGGSNDPENLITLCAEHHDLVHQLSFPIEEQYGWRSPAPIHAADAPI